MALDGKQPQTNTVRSNAPHWLNGEPAGNGPGTLNAFQGSLRWSSSKLLDSIPGREQRAQPAQPFQLSRTIFDVHDRPRKPSGK
jgi:hypothetical protein